MKNNDQQERKIMNKLAQDTTTIEEIAEEVVPKDIPLDFWIAIAIIILLTLLSPLFIRRKK